MGGVFLLLSKISFYGTALILIILILVLSFKFNKKMDNKDDNEVSNEYIASYFDGEYQNEIPGKDDGYVVEKIVCDNGATATWDNEEWGVNIRNATQKVKCSIYFIKTEYDFGYSKTEQIFIAPKTGTYKIETWGAQGDDWSGLGGCSSDITTIQKVPGGQGGYSVGYIELSENQKLYVYVGKKGGNQNPTGLTGSGPGGGASDFSYGGGGGSGYIGNTSLSNKAMYCYNFTESSEENTKTISTICEEETPTEKCAK